MALPAMMTIPSTAGGRVPVETLSRAQKTNTFNFQPTLGLRRLSCGGTTLSMGSNSQPTMSATPLSWLKLSARRSAGPLSCKTHIQCQVNNCKLTIKLGGFKEIPRFHVICASESFNKEINNWQTHCLVPSFLNLCQG